MNTPTTSESSTESTVQAGTIAKTQQRQPTGPNQPEGYRRYRQEGFAAAGAVAVR